MTSREIKFRAWFVAGDNSEVKGMIHDVVVYGDSLGCDSDEFNEALCGYHFDGEDLIPDDKSKPVIDGCEFNVYDNGEEWVFFEADVMQFTGLKDKNGKEVYDGDILRDDEAHYKIFWSVEAVAFDAERLEDGSNMIGFGCYGRDLIADIIQSSKYVGNIWQNPELLPK